MSLTLRLFLRLCDGAMLLYWTAAAIACAGLVTLPSTAMYQGYGTPRVDAWNWSFAPLDLAFAVAGLLSVRMARRGDAGWRVAAAASLLLTMCAGGMAIGYWALLRELDPIWWAANLLLLLLPLCWLPTLLQEIANSLRHSTESA